MVYSLKENECYDAYDMVDELEVPAPHQHMSKKSREVYAEICDGNPSLYVPHIKELLEWKKLKMEKFPITKEQIVKWAVCECGKFGRGWNKSSNAYASCCKEHDKMNRLKVSKIMTLIRYGVEFNLQNKDILKKTQIHWEGGTPFSDSKIQEKARQTLLERTGYDNAMKNPESLKKSMDTRMEIYHSYSPNSEKRKQTMLERHGVEYYSQSGDFKDLWKDKEFVASVKEKERNTRDKKWKEYLVNSSYKTHFEKDSLSNKYFSKTENMVYSYLTEIFNIGDIERQYYSDRYPWKCDFYIKSLDLFIEYQGFKTHGNHPFNKNNPEDVQKLQEMNDLLNDISVPNSNKALIKSIINGWTVSDVMKRNKAKENSLNFLEFFSPQEAKRWLEEFKENKWKFIAMANDHELNNIGWMDK